MTQLATDDFERADGGLGSNWTTVVAAMEIASGRAYDHLNGQSAALWNLVAFPEDHWSQCVLDTMSTATDCGEGPAVGINGSGGTGSMYFAQANTVETRLFKRTSGGAITQLGSDAAACALGDILYLQRVGTALTLKKNGSTIIGPITDASFSGGGAGMWGSYSSVVSGFIASWTAGDFGVPSNSVFQGRRNRPGRGPYSLGRYARSGISNVGAGNSAWPFTESVLPNAVTLTNMSGAYTDIDDSPDSPDASWLTWVH